VRINKYLARAGVTSRRKADELVRHGRVSRNGEAIHEPGVNVNPKSDYITVDGHPVSLPTEYVYFLLHKPQNTISSLDDPRGRTTVVELIPTTRRIHPVGRLDYDTTGVLLLTDDGDLTYQLTHPSNEVQRTYEITYEGTLPDTAAEQVQSGIDIGEDNPAAGDLEIL